MSIHTETVKIYINECEFDADCEFEYFAGEPAHLTGLPENCHPGEEAEIGPIKLEVYLHVTKAPQDMTYLLSIQVICEDIQEQLLEITEAG